MTRRESNLILAGIVVGLIAAAASLAVFGQRMVAVEVFGALFLKSLRMVVVPLVLASVVTGIAGLGDVRKLGKIGLRTLGYYAATTAIAVLIGMVVVSVMRPGVGVATATATVPEKVQAKTGVGWESILLSFVSENIFKSLAEMEMLPIIVFSLVLGGVLTTLGDKGKPVLAFFDGLNEAIMKMVRLIMWFAPIGIFGLVAARFASAGGPEVWKAMLASLGWYVAAVLIGLAIHGMIVLPVICAILGRRSPGRYAGSMFPAVLTAFSTASSSATLPLTIECATERAGVSKRAAGFVIPIGATVNMDGTALYESVAAVFIAQAYGIHLSPTDLVLVFLTATLASIGAAGIPEAGLFTMVIVLTAVKLPLEGVGLILAVDWLLDRFRTAINVWGDAVGAAYIDRVTNRAIPQ